MKVIEDILREVDLEVLRKAPHAQRKYNKITESLRHRFISKIHSESKSIKKAAEELNINYSSAKTILTMHRKKGKLLASFPSDECLTARTLPPKHLLGQSFMSTASNLSELNKDSEESAGFDHNHNNGSNSMPSNHNLEEQKMTNPVTTNSSSAFKRCFVQNKSFQFSSPQLSLNHLNNSSPSKTVSKMNSIIIAPPAQVEQQVAATAARPAQMTPSMMLSIQQHLQAQQQQHQQIQNTLQQLIMMQNAMLFSSSSSSSSNQQQQQPVQASVDPLVSLLLQQQLLMITQQQQQVPAMINSSPWAC